MFQFLIIIIISIIIGELVLIIIDVKKSKAGKASRISLPVRCFCLALIIFALFLGIEKTIEASERTRNTWEALIKATETVATEDGEKTLYQNITDWLNSTNPIFDGVTSEQRQVLIDWKNDYEHSH